MGGRTDPGSEKKFISINNQEERRGGERAGRRARKTGMGLLEAGSLRLNVRYEWWMLLR